MKTILFCNLPYGFSILKPLADVLEQKGYDYLWYISSGIFDQFPYQEMPSTQSIKVLEEFNSDAIFAPGNDVPYWLRGLKIQIFHGLAGEKKGHFRIRDYFDLYLTQGPFFTQKFKALALKYKNFDVIETGWPKLDKAFTYSKGIKERKASLLQQYNVKHIVLYAPTFSPSLTSAKILFNTIETLSNSEDLLFIVKFHDKMDADTVVSYKKIMSKNLLIVEDNDILPSLQMADLMLSDTSSVVYEFILLDKPVITLNSQSDHITWSDHADVEGATQSLLKTLQGNDDFKNKRGKIIEQYHPYTDGKSAQRMIEAAETTIKKQGVPNKRKIPLLRKFKMKKKYSF